MTLVAGSYEKFIWGFSLKTLATDQTLTLKPVFSYPSHTAPIKSVAVAGPVAASGGADDAIKIYDLPTSSEIGSLLDPAGAVSALSFFCSPLTPSLPRNLLAGSDDGAVRVYDADPFVLLKTVHVHRRGVSDLAVHPSGRLALTVGRDTTLAMVNLVRGRRSFSCRLDREATNVTYSLGDGERFFMVAEERVTVHDSEDARVLHEFDAEKKVLCVAPGEGGLLFTGGEDRSVTGWDATSGKLAFRIEAAHSTRVKGLVVFKNRSGGQTSEESNFIASASSDGVIRIWDVRMLSEEKQNVLAEINTKSRLTCLAGSSIKLFYRFTQQNLPTCKPTLTPGSVITTFLLIGIIFVPVGLVCLRASRSVVEIVDRYDVECIPEQYQSNKVAYIKDSSIFKNCTRYLKVQSHMKAPIYVYYELENYYQNHRRYVKSRSEKQLLYGLKYKDTSSCKPQELSNGLPIVPCGLIAWSLFNDTYSFLRGATVMNINRKNIAWKSDRDHKYGKHVYPVNFQNGTLIGGGKLDPNSPLSEQEDLIVWMRTAALPKFRKPYGRIEEDLNAGDVITVNLVNNYNTYSFGGKKKLVLTTSGWLGGQNDFLGLAYVATGFSCILIAILFALIHVKIPRPHGDSNFSPWNRKSNAS